MNYVIFFLKATVKNRQNRYYLFIFYRWRNRLWEHKWLVQDHRDSNWDSQILVYLSFFYWKAGKSLKINAYWHIEKAEIQNWITLKDFLSFDLPIMYVLLISTMPGIKATPLAGCWETTGLGGARRIYWRCSIPQQNWELSFLLLEYIPTLLLLNLLSFTQQYWFSFQLC